MDKSFFITLLFLAITPVFISGCNFHTDTGAEKGPQAFPYVSVPTMLTGQEAAEYAASHYWNRYFDSTQVWNGISDTLIGGVTENDMTQAVRDYIMALWSIPYDKALEAQRHLMSLAEESAVTDTSGHIYDFIVTVMESALWNPLSELRNEGFYIPVVESVLSTRRTGPDVPAGTTAAIMNISWRHVRTMPPAHMPLISLTSMPKVVCTASTRLKASTLCYCSPIPDVRPAGRLSVC